MLVSNNIQPVPPSHECADATIHCTDAPSLQQTVEEAASPASSAMHLGISLCRTVDSHGAGRGNEKLPRDGAPQFIEDRWCALVRFIEDEKAH